MVDRIRVALKGALMNALPRFALAASAALFMPWVAAATASLDTAAIESATGLNGTYDATEKVFKVSKPRDDVKISVAGRVLSPYQGLASSAAFMSMGRSTMVMGDTVLLEDEVDAAMSAALEGGLQVTALHNHFFHDQPKVYFMHIGGTGDARQLAAAVKAMYDRVAQVRAANPDAAARDAADVPAASDISAEPLAVILHGKPDRKDGMVKFTFGRTTRMHGVTVGNQMGVNTWAAFAGSDENATVDGDFAMREEDLQPVLKSMRSSGISIVSIHQHMVQETPRIMFLHYWGHGRATELAMAVRKALDSEHTLK
jgi:hypothetical protein